MRIRWIWALIGIALVAPTGYSQEAIPAGTVLPVALSATLSSTKTKPGAVISARLMQDVRLPWGVKIRKGTKLTGHLIAVQPASHGSGAKLALAFDRLLASKGGMAMATDLRALASPAEVEGAHIPTMGMGCGDSSHSWTTTQIGGDVVYWGGGPVENDHGPVGEPVTGTDGVLAKLTAKPESPCRGDVGENDGPQALWVFSSDACGTYGLNQVAIAHAGRTEPLGEIELGSSEGDIKLPSGTAMLLRVIAGQK
jgi:hypothetical protein